MKTKSQIFIRLITILFFAFSLAPATALSIEYDHLIELKKMTFAWKIQGEKLHVKLTAQTKGWVGIGFNPSIKMQDASYVIGYVKNGSVVLTDAFGIRPKEHIDDTAARGTNDITEISGSEKGGTTTIEFAIPMNSGDSTDSKLSGDDYTNVLLAFGKGQDNFTERHRFRTRLMVNLGNGKQK